MNRLVLISVMMSTFFLFSQDSPERYVEEANKMYVKGDYEGAFSQINNYFFVTDNTEVTAKGRQLGESIYYFYIRSLFSSNQFIGLSFIEKSLEENPSLASDRVMVAYNRLKILQNGHNTSTDYIDNSEVDNNELDIVVETEYSKDELTLLLKSSLLAGQESAQQVGRVTFLLVLLIIVIFLSVISITVFIVFSIKSSKRNRVQPVFTPTLIGQKVDSVAEFDTLLEKCREIAVQIDQATGRKNNSLNSAELVYKISKEFGYSDKEALLFFSASLVYDIGLLGIDEKILKSDHISEDDFELIKKHVSLGETYMNFIPENYKNTFFEAITMHHENLDGSGYPNKLLDSQIPFLPRVLRVVESYLSQISSREYKVISDKETALGHLRNQINIYDSGIVEVLDKVI